MYSLDYTLLEGMAIGSRKEVARAIDAKESLKPSKERLVQDRDLLRRVEEAAVEAGFPTTLYFDSLSDHDLCFALNPLENAVIYAQSGNPEVKKVPLPRPLGYTRLEPEQVDQPESPAQIFESVISPELPLSYGMYTLIRLRHYILGQFDPQEISKLLHTEVGKEIQNNEPEARKWLKSIDALLPKLK